MYPRIWYTIPISLSWERVGFLRLKEGERVGFLRLKEVWQLEQYAVEMLHITKRFPGIIANDDITLQLKKGEIHALLGENGAGKSTLMSVLFGLYQPEAGEIHMDGRKVEIRNPNDANALGIGMVHQHFKLVECFTVLDNIILGVEPCKHGFLNKAQAREKVQAISDRYGLHVDLDAKVEDITVGMQQRTEILKMLYRENEKYFAMYPRIWYTIPISLSWERVGFLRLKEASCSSPTSWRRLWKFPTGVPFCARVSISAP